jgi:hypothetical protein
LGYAVLCLLVGLNEGASKLLQKAKQWVEIAIAEDEGGATLGPGGNAASRHHTVAMCTWLLEGRHDAEALQQFVVFEDKFIKQPAIAKDKIEVSLVLPTYINARAFERTLEIFAVARIPEPKSLEGIRNGAQMSYVLARHRMGLDYTADEVDGALKRFLMRHMDKWLGDGHAVQAAEWMKIAYWDPHEAEMSPKEAILKCYDHLPHCTRPV